MTKADDDDGRPRNETAPDTIDRDRFGAPQRRRPHGPQPQDRRQKKRETPHPAG